MQKHGSGSMPGSQVRRDASRAGRLAARSPTVPQPSHPVPPSPGGARGREGDDVRLRDGGDRTSWCDEGSGEAEGRRARPSRAPRRIAVGRSQASCARRHRRSDGGEVRGRGALLALPARAHPRGGARQGPVRRAAGLARLLRNDEGDPVRLGRVSDAAHAQPLLRSSSPRSPPATATCSSTSTASSRSRGGPT